MEEEEKEGMEEECWEKQIRKAQTCGEWRNGYDKDNTAEYVVTLNGLQRWTPNLYAYVLYIYHQEERSI